ncbi:MAG: hypothetical protein WBO92_04995 [Candidatus Moraniibacteriota bacterium]
MRPLKEYIGKRSGGAPKALLDDKTVFFLFRKIIQEEYGTRGVAELEPVAFSEGILSVKSNNPLYSSELWIRRETILGRMNAALEQDVIQELRLVRYAP